MSQKFIDDLTFQGKDFTVNTLEKGDYENCQFINCNFAGVRLSYINFIDCQFENCDFSNAKLTETGLRNIEFKTCKLIGIRFDGCNDFLFAANFLNSRLDYSSFHQVNAQKTSFKNCSLIEVDFTETNLKSVSFDNSDLSNAVFEATNLTTADFRTAYSFSIEPSKNLLNNAKFSKNNLEGLLRKYKLDLES